MPVAAVRFKRRRRRAGRQSSVDRAANGPRIRDPWILIVFAVDSIPAIFAILGLRALYSCLAALVVRFRCLEPALIIDTAVSLAFVVGLLVGAPARCCNGAFERREGLSPSGRGRIRSACVFRRVSQRGAQTQGRGDERAAVHAQAVEGQGGLDGGLERDVSGRAVAHAGRDPHLS